jgi:transposase InsO family protein
MIQGGPYEPRKCNQKNTKAPVSRKDGRTGSGSRTGRPISGVQTRRHRTSTAFSVEAKVSSRRHQQSERNQARPEGRRRSSISGIKNRDRKIITGPARNLDRATSYEKKESLGLDGPLYGRHLTKDQREALMIFIDEVRASKSLTEICEALQLHPRSYYRWKSGQLSSQHGGGGGKNKITPLEEKRVVTLSKKNPGWHCRRIAYHLEQKSKVFIGKTKVAEIMKAHGLNHPFERNPAKFVVEPADMLLHEPWAKNLIWGMDWTWVTVNGKFMFLLVLIDWYSRKILSWGLYHQITQHQVVTVVTEAVAIERIDLMPKNVLKPFVVADHGSANCAKYTKNNIEIQGLKLWLSGIGRPTGNARTERVIGTLKREEIDLQEQYANEDEAKSSIKNAIWDYNFNRPMYEPAQRCKYNF